MSGSSGDRVDGGGARWESAPHGSFTPLGFGRLIQEWSAQPELPAIGLAEYRKLVAAVPRPTPSQMKAFAEYVARERHWHKLLPMAPPGEPFTFYVDPHAGLERIVVPGNRVLCLSGAEAGRTGHRSTAAFPPRFGRCSTEAHRAFFGGLAYGRSREGVLVGHVLVHLPGGETLPGLSLWGETVLQVTEEAGYRLPPEVLAAGTIRLTGVIRESSGYWMEIEPDTEAIPWPEETGGQATGRALVALYRRRSREPRPHWGNEDEEERYLERQEAFHQELQRLVAPERRRLRREMVRAMERVVALLYGEPA